MKAVYDTQKRTKSDRAAHSTAALRTCATETYSKRTSSYDHAYDARAVSPVRVVSPVRETVASDDGSYTYHGGQDGDTGLHPGLTCLVKVED